MGFKFDLKLYAGFCSWAKSVVIQITGENYVSFLELRVNTLEKELKRLQKVEARYESSQEPDDFDIPI